MITCNLAEIWTGKGERVQIRWPYQFRDHKHMGETRKRLEQLYEGDAFFILYKEPKTNSNE